MPYPTRFLQIVTFPSNFISCNSYLLIVSKKKLDVLVVLTQGFPLMRIKVSAIDNASRDKPFFFEHIFDGELFLLGSPGVLRFPKVLLV